MDKLISKHLTIILIFALTTALISTSCLNNGFNFGAQTEFASSDTTITFLWTEDIYDEESGNTFNSMVINEQFCDEISKQEKAALGYVATFIGNECDWDGDYKDDRSNLKCIILTALDLGYQCSNQHLGFLRRWFRNDTVALEQLEEERCPTTPWGATIQDWFEEITITSKNDTIAVRFKASGFVYRDAIGWSWTETDYFKVDKNGLTLVKVDKSEVERYGLNRKGNNQ